MTDCNKYKVISFSTLAISEAKTIENWLNSLYEYERLELVAVVKDKYIFKRNAYIVSIEKTSENKCECS